MRNVQINTARSIVLFLYALICTGQRIYLPCPVHIGAFLYPCLRFSVVIYIIRSIVILTKFFPGVNIFLYICEYQHFAYFT